MTDSTRNSVLLIGSFPTSAKFKTPQDIFDVAGPALAGCAAHLPDGEPQGWINFTTDTLGNSADIELLPGKDPKLLGAYITTEDMKRVMQNPEAGAKVAGSMYRVKEGVKPEEVRFAPTGYVDVAIKSYRDFVKARQNGKIAPGVKFQQSLPSPNAIIMPFRPEDRERVRAGFEKHLFAEIRQICDAIPHQDLCFQWDIVEVSQLEVATHFESIEEYGRMQRKAQIDPAQLQEFTAMLARACNAVPADVELGVHLCYGNFGGRHGIEPKDTSVMVNFANTFIPLLRRPLNWLHMPVPIERSDDEYFKPLANLKLPSGTRFFLGLVHPRDGVEGARKRIAAAKKYVPDFGVATECGLRFFEVADLPRILDLHREAAQQVKAVS